MRKKYLYYIGESKPVNHVAGYVLTLFNFIFGMGVGLMLSRLWTVSKTTEHLLIILIALGFAIIVSALLFNGSEPFWALDQQYLYYPTQKKKHFINKIICFIKYLLFMDNPPEKISLHEIKSITLFYKEVDGMYRLPCYSIFFTLHFDHQEDKTLPCLNLTKQTVIAEAFEYLSSLNITIEDEDHLLEIMKNTTQPVTLQIEMLERGKISKA